jgi:hypothetical protein
MPSSIRRLLAASAHGFRIAACSLLARRPTEASTARWVPANADGG